VWLQVATAGTHKLGRLARVLIGGLARVRCQRRELGRRLAVHEALVVAAGVEQREMRRQRWVIAI